MRYVVCAMLAFLSSNTVALAQSVATPSDNEERQQLRESLETACKQFSADDQWTKLDDCNRAWFKKHEEAVWRLKLNPHRHAAQPSS